MNFQDILISGRNTIINQISRVDSSNLLNPDVPDVKSFSDGIELAADIKRAINRFRSVVLEADQNSINYAALSKSEEYKDYCNLVRQLHLLDLKDIFSYNQRLSFWINLYNAMTVDAVIQFGIKKSVTEGWLGILSFFNKAAYQVGRDRFSLTDIEHGILRANKGFPYFFSPHFSSTDSRQSWVLSSFDPRIHFALNCASQSCPPIGLYNPDKVDSQLDIAARNFLVNNISVNFDKKEISLSLIFRWYQSDFGGPPGVLKFITNHLPEGDERQSWLIENLNVIKMVYQPYDWGLNGS